MDENCVYVADYNNNRVQCFHKADGRYLGQWGTKGVRPGQFDGAGGVAVDENCVYVTDSNNNRVRRE